MPREIRLDEAALRKLVSGQSVELKTPDGEEVHVILADIGWGRIYAAVEGARPPQRRDQPTRTNPPRARGRPPLPADEAKLHPLVIRTARALREELEKTAEASGRSLTQEIEARLARTLLEDHEKDEAELRLEAVTREIMDLVHAFWPAGPAAAPAPERKPALKQKSRRAR